MIAFPIAQTRVEIVTNCLVVSSRCYRKLSLRRSHLLMRWVAAVGLIDLQHAVMKSRLWLDVAVLVKGLILAPGQ
jgi:hypothetical protein